MIPVGYDPTEPRDSKGQWVHRGLHFDGPVPSDDEVLARIKKPYGKSFTPDYETARYFATDRNAGLYSEPSDTSGYGVVISGRTHVPLTSQDEWPFSEGEVAAPGDLSDVKIEVHHKGKKRLIRRALDLGYSDLAKQTARPDIDLASSNAVRQPKPQQTVPAKQPKVTPAQVGATTAAVIAIAGALTAGLGTAALVQRIHSDLLRWDIEETTVAAVLRMARRGTAHKPNARLAGQGARLTEHIQVAKGHELARRAAYICNAALRVQHAVDDGESLVEAIRDEERNFALHEQARRGRLDAAAQVQVAADYFGQREHDGTLIGWYLNPLLNNEAECIAANGHNFYAEKGTVIGLPGAVHNNCGCYAGPPWTGAALVDEVFHNLRALVPVSHAKFQLRKRKGA